MTRLNRHAQKEKDLKKRMLQLKIFEKDIKETFVRAQGPGGQNVNKVASCVVLHHFPTDIQVKCQEERSQALNRYKARWLLVEKIEHKRAQEHLKEIEEFQKQQRKNRPRPRFIKEGILKRKHYQSEKKVSRKKVKPYQLDAVL